MSTTERRDDMLSAVESPEGFGALRELVKRLLADGLSAETILEDLSQIRALVPEEVEDLILDVMDQLVGWCPPQLRLVPPVGSQ
jgi:hypothetical protein